VDFRCPKVSASSEPLRRVEKRFAPLDYTAVIRYASPTQWLSDQLATAVYELGYTRAQEWIQLPALVLDSNHLGTIATPLPLQLATRSPALPIISAEAVGHALIDQLNQLNQLPQSLWIAPRYWMHPKGWLYAEFSLESLAQWLQTLLASTPQLEFQNPLGSSAPSPPSKGISSDPELFELQYAHARCCSLLHLGNQSRLIQLTDKNFDTLTFPNPVPWLTARGELLLRTESEQKLLRTLMQFPQSLCVSKAIYGRLHSPEPGCQTIVHWPLNNRTLQKHRVWSQLFERFYRECRVLGAIQTKTPELAQARFASLILLRNLLKFWLNSVLQIDAPTQL
jgi:DALR anticodon binding domain